MTVYRLTEIKNVPNVGTIGLINGEWHGLFTYPSSGGKILYQSYKIPDCPFLLLEPEDGTDYSFVEMADK